MPMDDPLSQFMILCRNFLADRSQVKQITVLLQLLEVWTMCTPKERLFFVDKLFNMDFCESFSHAVFSSKVALKVCMKIALILSEHVNMKDFCEPMVRAHVRALILFGKRNSSEEMFRDGAMFLEIISARFLKTKWNFSDEYFGENVGLEAFKEIAARTLKSIIKGKRAPSELGLISAKVNRGVVFEALDLTNSLHSTKTLILLVKVHDFFLKNTSDPRLPIYLTCSRLVLKSNERFLNFFIRNGGFEFVEKASKREPLERLNAGLLTRRLNKVVIKGWKKEKRWKKDKKCEVEIQNERIARLFVAFLHRKSIGPEAAAKELLSLIQPDLEQTDQFCLTKLIFELLLAAPKGFLQEKYPQLYEYLLKSIQTVGTWFDEDLRYLRFALEVKEDPRCEYQTLFKILQKQQIPDEYLLCFFQSHSKDWIIYSMASGSSSTANLKLNFARLLVLRHSTELNSEDVHRLTKLLPHTEPKLLKSEHLTALLLTLICQQELSTDLRNGLCEYILEIQRNIEVGDFLRISLVRSLGSLLKGKGTTVDATCKRLY